jgi:hypothetical protein
MLRKTYPVGVYPVGRQAKNAALTLSETCAECYAVHPEKFTLSEALVGMRSLAKCLR